jgi:hypothetical protein
MEQIRICLALSLEELLPARPLRILPIPDLEPLRRVLEVGSELVLRHNALEITFASECKQLFPVRLDVVAKQDALAVLGQDGAEALLAFDQRSVGQILAVTEEQVEGDETRLPLPEQEIVELGPPFVVKTHDLAVEDD